MEQPRSHSQHKGKIAANVISYGERFATKERRTISYLALRKLELEDMTIYNSTIDTSKLKNCSLYNCLIVGSRVHNSELNNCTVRQEVQEVQYSDVQEPSSLSSCKVMNW
jgi:hypothetical protein